MGARIEIDGVLPAQCGISRETLSRAAAFFASRSEKRARLGPWREVAVHLVGDGESARINSVIMGHEGPTDVITQRYDSIPGEPQGLSGELYVNAKCALREGPKRPRWSAALELLLYVAHGIDHLSGADDATEAEYRAMRRRELSWISAARRKGIA